MSSSPEFVDSSDYTASASPEKSRFSRRCSLLSQYLKENGSFGDLSLGMTCNSDENVPEIHRQTMNFFPTNENQIDALNRNDVNPQNNVRSMDLFPQQAGFPPSPLKPDVHKKADSSNSKPVASDSPKAQMTIFYNGQVIVFDDFPAEKAKEVMLLAGGKGSFQNISPVFSTNLAKSPTECTTSVNAIPSFTNNLFQDCIQANPKAIPSDLPIARRASLHRFLQKRKDRIISRAPYTINGPIAAQSKPVETKSWLGLAAQPVR